MNKCIKNKQTVAFFALFTVFVLFVSCQKKGSSQATSSGNVPTSQTAPTADGSKEGSKDQGASSGGGGYVTKNSKKLLKIVVEDVAKEIKQASPFLFKDLPVGWSQLKLYEVLTNIRMSPTKDVQRDNSDLLFNYGTDEKGPYIEALRPFFLVYGSVPMDFQEVYGHDMYGKNEGSDTFKATVLDLKLKVLHEMSHLLGKNEKQAEEYSLELLRKLEEDFYTCMVPREQLEKIPNVLWVSPTELNWVKEQGGGFANCFGEKPGCKQVYDFNWIRSNGWLYHQAKNKMLRSYYTITFYSHLDPQPYEDLKDQWTKEVVAPGVQWEKSFGKGEGMRNKENGNSVEYFDEPAKDTGKFPDSAIGLKVTFESQDNNSRVFKSAKVNVPLMDITVYPSADIKTMYNNPAAPRGKFIGNTKEFDLKCEYFGKNNAKADKDSN